jgi:hypothetical protein
MRRPAAQQQSWQQRQQQQQQRRQGRQPRHQQQRQQRQRPLHAAGQPSSKQQAPKSRFANCSSYQAVLAVLQQQQQQQQQQQAQLQLNAGDTVNLMEQLASISKAHSSGTPSSNSNSVFLEDQALQQLLSLVSGLLFQLDHVW